MKVKKLTGSFTTCQLTLSDQISTGPSGPRRKCGVNSKRGGELRRGGFADPEHLNLRRVEAAFGCQNPKRKTCFSDDSHRYIF